jgi:hypothetical protein
LGSKRHSHVSSPVMRHERNSSPLSSCRARRSAQMAFQMCPCVSQLLWDSPFTYLCKCQLFQYCTRTHACFSNVPPEWWPFLSYASVCCNHVFHPLNCRLWPATEWQIANVCMSIFAWLSSCLVANCAVISSILSVHLLQTLVDVSHHLVPTHQEQHVLSDKC